MFSELPKDSDVLISLQDVAKRMEDVEWGINLQRL